MAGNQLSSALAAMCMCVLTVNLAQFSVAEDLLFKRHVINDQTDYSAAALIDVDHDGQLDIVCGGDWYQAPNWQKHFVADIPRIGGRPDGFSHLEFDVNRDGWMDVITVNYRSRSIKWMEHPGPSLGRWTVHTAVEPGPMETGRLVDIDGDGQLDLLPNGANFAAWWEFRWNSESPGSAPAWIRHELPTEAGGHGLGFGDIDGDGRGDIIGQFGWLSSPPDVRHGQWQWHPDFKMERGSIPLLVVDPDEDGDNDIVWCSAHGFGVYWYEQTQGLQGERIWTRHAIDTSWSQGHSPLWVDMDGDGHPELIAGKRYMAHGGADPGEYDPIVSYRYQFNRDTHSWDRWALSPLGDRVGMGLDPKVADIDGDGDLDLMASGRSGLYWLENLGPGDSQTIQPPAPNYLPGENLLSIKNAAGEIRAIEDPETWGLRRQHIASAIERLHGAIPSSNQRVSLDTVSHGLTSSELYATQELEYRIAPNRRTTARLLIPNAAAVGESRGMLCLFEPSSRELAYQVASDLAKRGYVCLVPELDLSSGPKAMSDQVWQSMRAIDVLQACAYVHGERIGAIGNASQGQLGLHVAALDQRCIVNVCDLNQAPALGSSADAGYSLAELLAATAPRALHVLLPAREVSATLLTQAAQESMQVYELRKVADHLVLSMKALVADSREEVYQWLDQCW